MLPTVIDFEKEMVDCSNMFVGLDNILRVRYGTTEWYDSEVDSSVHGIGSYRGKLVYAVSNKVFMENTEIGTCASTGTVTFINAKGNLYILDGGVLSGLMVLHMKLFQMHHNAGCMEYTTIIVCG